MAYAGYRNGDGSRTNLISRGMVVINATMRQKPGFGTGLTRGDTLLHEIGHAMGLSHAGADEQMMYAYLTRTPPGSAAATCTRSRRAAASWAASTPAHPASPLAAPPAR